MSSVPIPLPRAGSCAYAPLPWGGAKREDHGDVAALGPPGSERQQVGRSGLAGTRAAPRRPRRRWRWRFRGRSRPPMTGRRDTVALKRLRAHRDSASACRPPPLATAIPPVLGWPAPGRSTRGQPRTVGRPGDRIPARRSPVWRPPPGRRGQPRTVGRLGRRSRRSRPPGEGLRCRPPSRTRCRRAAGLLARARILARSGSPGRVWGPVCVPSVESSRALNYGPTGGPRSPVFLTPADPGRPRQKMADECPGQGVVECGFQAVRGRVSGGGLYWVSKRAGPAWAQKSGQGCSGINPMCGIPPSIWGIFT